MTCMVTEGYQQWCLPYGIHGHTVYVDFATLTSDLSVVEVLYKWHLVWQYSTKFKDCMATRSVVLANFLFIVIIITMLPKIYTYQLRVVTYTTTIRARMKT